MAECKRYDNGLRLVVQRIDGLLSVTMGILVGAGASMETDEEDGISHFIEHMSFKGTKRFDESQISNAFDEIGASQNAFTSKDMTCYYAKSISEHTERAFELLSDLFLHSVYPEDGVNRERSVILEEIAMNEDTPEDYCLDLLSEAYYGKRNYGRTILGPAENVKNFTVDDILAYRNALYTTNNVVISFAGDITLSEADELVQKYVSDCIPHGKQERQTNISLCGKHICKQKQIEQVHMGIAYPSYERYHRNTDAAVILNSALGGSMSSRLFQSVREKKGLAYNVYSYLSPYQEAGTLVIYAGVNAKNVDSARDAIFDVVEQLKKEGITQEELKRGKEQMKASTIFAQESTSSQMLLYGKYMLYRDELYDIEQKMRDVNAVTMDNIRACLDDQFKTEHMASAVLGKVRRTLL
ncbi:MAG: insulinase family protein [Clostridia bacterium]|nr:insulinase family protein [Clostridia bacterium]